MASNKKQSEGIALLSMYKDEDDDEMDDVEEEGEYADAGTRGGQHHQDAGAGDEADEDFSADTGRMAVINSGNAATNIPTPQRLVSPQERRRLVSSVTTIRMREKLTIVDYGHDEVAMSPEPEEGEIGDQLHVTNVTSIASISVNLNSIPVLNGENFKDWKENMKIILGCMDLDYALRVEQPPSPSESSASEERKDYEKWDHSNRMSLMIIKRGIPEVFRGTISDEINSAKTFLAEIEKRFAKSDKAETSTLLQNLISMRYQGNGNIREYIMGMSNIASKLKALKLEMSEDLLIHLVLLSLPAQFSQFKISYNYQREKWTLNELISFCVQEEERLKREMTESAHYDSTSKDKAKRKIISEPKNEAAKGLVQKKQKQDNVCYFCKGTGHQKKKCAKYHTWRAKKGLPELPKA